MICFWRTCALLNGLGTALEAGWFTKVATWLQCLSHPVTGHTPNCNGGRSRDIGVLDKYFHAIASGIIDWFLKEFKHWMSSGENYIHNTKSRYFFNSLPIFFIPHHLLTTALRPDRTCKPNSIFLLLFFFRDHPISTPVPTNSPQTSSLWRDREAPRCARHQLPSGPRLCVCRPNINY